MFAAIATLAVQGGDAVTDDVNKIYRDRPQPARGEGAITEFRAWARQSYEEAFV